MSAHLHSDRLHVWCPITCLSFACWWHNSSGPALITWRWAFATCHSRFRNTSVNELMLLPCRYARTRTAVPLNLLLELFQLQIHVKVLTHYSSFLTLKHVYLDMLTLHLRLWCRQTCVVLMPSNMQEYTQLYCYRAIFSSPVSLYCLLYTYFKLFLSLTLSF